MTLRQRPGLQKQSSSFMKSFKDLDAYARPLEDFRIKTTGGALLTLGAFFVIAVLILSEFVDYASTKIEPKLVVDKARKERMNIYVNITLPHIPCFMATLDVLDVAGESQNDIDQTIYKLRLNESGQTIGFFKQDMLKENEAPVDKDYCGSCYGARPQGTCCNTCEDVRNAYAEMSWSFTNPENIEQCNRQHYTELINEQASEGCLVYGYLSVNKVAGNFHIAPGKSSSEARSHVHDLHDYTKIKGRDFTHTINSLAFGQKVSFKNPLDNVSKETDNSAVNYQYHIKVVSTKYEYINGKNIDTNQYSVTEHEKKPTIFGPSGIPGLFFSYDISPMLVIYTETKKPFAHFLTDVCAVVGGVFTVAGLLDSFIYSAGKSLKKKMELGKSS